MSNLIKHAEREFEILGWPGNDEMQKMACDNVIELLTVLSSQGHSGGSIGYILNLFMAAAKYQPLTPLTGEDSEWMDVGEQNGTLYQNIRFGAIFKDDDGAYWIDGKVFEDENGFTFTSKDSHVPVEFPWTYRDPEYVKVKGDTDES